MQRIEMRRNNLYRSQPLSNSSLKRVSFKKDPSFNHTTMIDKSGNPVTMLPDYADPKVWFEYHRLEPKSNYHCLSPETYGEYTNRDEYLSTKYSPKESRHHEYQPFRGDCIHDREIHRSTRKLNEYRSKFNDEDVNLKPNSFLYSSFKNNRMSPDMKRFGYTDPNHMYANKTHFDSDEEYSSGFHEPKSWNGNKKNSFVPPYFNENSSLNRKNKQYVGMSEQQKLYSLPRKNSFMKPIIYDDKEQTYFYEKKYVPRYPNYGSYHNIYVGDSSYPRSYLSTSSPHYKNGHRDVKDTLFFSSADALHSELISDSEDNDTVMNKLIQPKFERDNYSKLTTSFQHEKECASKYLSSSLPQFSKSDYNEDFIPEYYSEHNKNHDPVNENSSQNNIGGEEKYKIPSSLSPIKHFKNSYIYNENTTPKNFYSSNKNSLFSGKPMDSPCFEKNKASKLDRSLRPYNNFSNKEKRMSPNENTRYKINENVDAKKDLNTYTNMKNRKSEQHDFPETGKNIQITFEEQKDRTDSDVENLIDSPEYHRSVPGTNRRNVPNVENKSKGNKNVFSKSKNFFFFDLFRRNRSKKKEDSPKTANLLKQRIDEDSKNRIGKNYAEKDKQIPISKSKRSQSFSPYDRKVLHFDNVLHRSSETDDKYKLTNQSKLKRSTSNAVKTDANRIPRSHHSAPTSFNSSESDASHFSHSSNKSVFLHAPAVADIPPPSSGSMKSAKSKPDLTDQPKMYRQVTRSVSMFAPWKPKSIKEAYEVDYSSQNNTKNQLYSRPPRPPRKKQLKT